MATVDFVLLKKAAIAAFFRFKFRYRRAVYSLQVSSILQPFPKRLDGQYAKALAGIVVNDDVTPT